MGFQWAVRVGQRCVSWQLHIFNLLTWQLRICNLLNFIYLIWHISFILHIFNMTYIIYICVTRQLHIFNPSRIYVTRLIHTFVTRLIRIWMSDDKTNCDLFFIIHPCIFASRATYLWYDSFIYFISCIYIWHESLVYLCHDTFAYECVTWRQHPISFNFITYSYICAMSHAHMCVAWHIRMCDMTPLYECTFSRHPRKHSLA